MISPLQEFYLKQPEPNRSCYEALKDILLRFSPDITEEWKYKLPFFYYKGKMCCYFWKDKKTQMPYIGFSKGKQMNHPSLVRGDRKLMAIYYVDPTEDIDLETLNELLEEAVKWY